MKRGGKVSSSRDKRDSPTINLRAVPDPWSDELRLREMRKLMRYADAHFREDWETALSLAQLMATGQNERHLQPLLDGCMDRVLAYLGNNPDARPF